MSVTLASSMQLKYNSHSPAMITPRSVVRSLPRSQALTERDHRLTFNVSVSGSQTPRFGLKRCKTMLEHRPEQVYKPRKWYSESCTMDYIRHLRHWNKETESKLKETMHVLKMQRSRSDLDVRADVQSIGGGSLYGAGLMRERSQIFLGNVQEHVRRESLQQTNKQEVKISKAVVPRKGLIQLSTGETEGLDPFGVIGEKRTSVSHDLPHPGSGGKTRSLIKRKDILEQIKMGNRLLEEYEEQKQKDEEMTKTLGEYTMLDLQSHILDLTDAKSLKRKTSGMLDSPAPGAPTPTRKPKPKPAPKEKVTLPAINNFTPFG